MGLYDYIDSQKYCNDNFYALLMGAIRKADDLNMAKLEVVFPDVVKEMKARYNAPGGRLEGE